ncbi:MAG: lipid-binding SYLF domain-containing protein [Candidatus Latescibacteria bacterium]|nr:lipid-binding SYLF domain-containing protein [Candidatus Latescibacterota bacterium]
MSKLMLLALVTVCLSAALSQPADALWNPLKKDKKEEKAKDKETKKSKVPETIATFKKKDPDIASWFGKAYGYAVFPTVGKGGIWLGGAYGEGEVYTEGKLIGRTSLKQITVGFQLGGQSYSEIIFFKNKKALDSFTEGGFAFDAQVSAVAVTAGASKDAAYSSGVAVFTLAKGGLMYEASVGGQKSTFNPIE